MRKGFLIQYMRKCANISPSMRRPLVIYDFATAPFWISLYMRKILFSFYSLWIQRPFIFWTESPFISCSFPGEGNMCLCCWEYRSCCTPRQPWCWNFRTIYTVKKSLFVLAFRHKIALLRIDNQAFDSGTFSNTHKVFYIPPSQKSLPVPRGRLFTSLMLEKLRLEKSWQ